MSGIIAGVGTAKGFDSQGNMIFKAKALTDSGFNISTSKEEIRGGQGASLQGQYFHTTQFTVQLKDALFDMNYLALQVGGKIKQGGDIFVTEQVIVDESNLIKVAGKPKQFADYGIIGWYNHVGKDDTKKITFTGIGNNESRDSGAKQGETICVTYLQEDITAREFEVATDYVPSEIHLVFDMPIFNGSATDKKNIGTQSKIGFLQVDVPRFQFDGSVDLASTMTGATTSNISGTAMQSGTSTCSGRGIYARCTEHIEGRGEFDNVSAIVVEDSKLELKNKEKQKLTVLAFSNNNTAPRVLDNKKLTFTVANGGSTFASVDTDGVVTGLSASGTAIIEIKVTSKTELEASATVTVS